jgi:hypothetical protein
MKRQTRNRRRGTATVEFALVLPVLATLFLGMCEVGRALNATVIVQNSATYGGRMASIGQSTNLQVKQAVLNSLKISGLPTTNAVVTVSNLTQPGTDVKQASTLDKLEVDVTLPFKDVKWGVSGFIVHDGDLLKGKATFYSARVNPRRTFRRLRDSDRLKASDWHV